MRGDSAADSLIVTAAGQPVAEAQFAPHLLQIADHHQRREGRSTARAGRLLTAGAGVLVEAHAQLRRALEDETACRTAATTASGSR